MQTLNFEQSYTQHQKQVQKLAMTQQLQQSIQMLQMNREDLTGFLKQKALGNPLIEVKVKGPAESDFSAPTISRTASESYHQFMDERMNRLPNKPVSLFAYVVEQIHLNMRETYLRKLVLWLSEFLDKNGYLTISLEEASRQAGAEQIQMLDALTLLQQLEPAGVGARNLQECLMLQTERDEYAPNMAYVILEEDFHDFANRKWEKIAKKYAISLKEVQIVFDYVQLLSPHPGAAFARENEQFVRPDLIVREGQHELSVHSVQSGLPIVTFQKEYYQQMMALGDKEVSTFMKGKYTEYDWIQKSLAQRGETIARVGAAIVEKQKAYFLNEKRPLSPLTLKEIAEEVGLHESTVSRAINGKYLQASFGIVELKNFFTAGLTRSTPKTSGKKSEDELVSVENVKQELKQLIDEEDKKKPLSDQKIVDLLKDKGIQISRRTVAKYRDNLHIPSSSKRKRVF